TKHVQALEEEFETKLIIYENKQVRLTDKGKELIPYLTSLVKLNRMATDIFQTREDHVQIHLGVCLTLGNYFINEIIDSFYEAYPKIELVVYVENTRKLEAMLSKNEIDIALSLGPTAQLNLNTKTLKEQEMVIIAAKDNPLLGQTLSIEDLTDKKIYLREEGAGTRDVFLLYLNKYSLSLEDFSMIKTAGSIELVKQLVSKGDGIAPIYKLSVEKELENRTLRILPVKEFKISYPITILTPKNVALSGT